jgi:hypothetical protein
MMVNVGSVLWQGEEEGRALAWLRFHPYPAAMSLHDLLANRQTDPGP